MRFRRVLYIKLSILNTYNKYLRITFVCSVADPDPQHSGKPDATRIKVKNLIRICFSVKNQYLGPHLIQMSGDVEAQGSYTEAHLGAVEALNEAEEAPIEALECFWITVRRFGSL
jgi:hypothetical protein